MPKDTDTAEDVININELQIETLAGDLRDAMLMQFREARTPWSVMTEDMQRDIANSMDLAAKDLVRNTVRLMTGFEWPRCVVTLGEVKIMGDKGIEAKIKTANVEENRNVLGDHVGDHVMVLMVDSETFMGEREPAEISPDQSEMDVDGEE